MKKYIAVIVIGSLLTIAGTLYAGKRPEQNIGLQHHPNLAAAQSLSMQAYEKLVAAQKANEFDMGGHAAKAKELLVQANEEIKLAAQALNKK